MSIKIFNEFGQYVGPDINIINTQARLAIITFINNFNANTYEAKIIKALRCTIYLWGLTHWDKNNNSIDIQCWPVSGCFMIAEILKKTGQTVYMSSYNRHIHFDNRSSGVIQVELLQRNGKIYKGKVPTEKTQNDVIQIGNFENEKMYLFFWYGLNISRFEQSYETSLFLAYYNITHNDYFNFFDTKLPDLFTNIKETGKEISSELLEKIKKYGLIGLGILAGILIIPRIIKK